MNTREHCGARMEILSESATCPICLDVFHIPMTLPFCGHSFCKACIEELPQPETHQISCPTCRKTGAVDLSSLKQNFALSSLCENLKAMDVTKPMDATKDSCSNPKSAAKNRKRREQRKKKKAAEHTETAQHTPESTSAPGHASGIPESVVKMNHCARCGVPTDLTCSKCHKIFVCSSECFGFLWPNHKAECGQSAPIEPKMKSVQMAFDWNSQDWHFIQHTYERGAAVLRKYGLQSGVDSRQGFSNGVESHVIKSTGRPTKGDSLSEKQRMNCFLEFLEVYDSSGEAFNGRSQEEKMVANRTFNNTMREASEVLSPVYLKKLYNRMADLRIGGFNK